MSVVLACVVDSLLLHQEKMNAAISSPSSFLLHSLLHQGVHSWWLLQLHAPQTHFKGCEVGQPMMCPPAHVCQVLLHCCTSCSSVVTAVFFVTVWCQLPSLLHAHSLQTFLVFLSWREQEESEVSTAGKVCQLVLCC